MQANYVQRMRLIFTKNGPARFIGHLDLARTLERILNRAKIPVAYTQGYNRRPRMQLADALPLGFTSECEIADIWLAEETEPRFVMTRLAQKTAPGVDFLDAYEVSLDEQALQARTTEATYQVTFIDLVNAEELQRSMSQLLAADSIPRERRGKAYDLRPLIINLKLVSGADDGAVLRMRLSNMPGRTGRPDEVLEAMNLDPAGARIHRTSLVLSPQAIAN
jgi:radical SAM-linked protein